MTAGSTTESIKLCVKRGRRPAKHSAPCAPAPKQTEPTISPGSRSQPVTQPLGKKTVRFCDATSVLPEHATNHPETWYEATDYRSFLQHHRLALSCLVQSLLKDDFVDASEYVGMEHQLSPEHFIARKLQCLYYTQLVVCQQYMKGDIQEIKVATKSFTAESIRKAHVRAVAALGEGCI